MTEAEELTTKTAKGDNPGSIAVGWEAALCGLYTSIQAVLRIQASAVCKPALN